VAGGVFDGAVYGVGSVEDSPDCGVDGAVYGVGAVEGVPDGAVGSVDCVGPVEDVSDGVFEDVPGGVPGAGAIMLGWL
jgi:hypothetical protein